MVFRCALCGASLQGTPGQTVVCPYCEASNQLDYASDYDRSIRIQHKLLRSRKEREALAETLLDEYVSLKTSYVIGEKKPELREKILFTYERYIRLMQVYAREMYTGQSGEFYEDALRDLEEQVQEQIARIAELLDNL